MDFFLKNGTKFWTTLFQLYNRNETDTEYREGEFIGELQFSVTIAETYIFIFLLSHRAGLYHFLSCVPAPAPDMSGYLPGVSVPEV